MKTFTTVVISLFLFTMLFGSNNEMISDPCNVCHKKATNIRLPDEYTTGRDTVLGDAIFEMDVQTITGCNRLLGIEFDGTYFYITGACDPPGNSVYVIDTNGTLVWQPLQGTVSSWGWRDIAWDGVYAGPDQIDTLYASDGSTVVKFSIDLTNGDLTNHGTFTGPENPNRGLAYKGDSAWFFTANFRNPCYKFNKTTSNIQSVSNSWAVYGAAYDTDPSEGGSVWWHSQDNPGTGYLLQIAEMDAITMAWTGVLFGFTPPSLLPMPEDTSMAGGLCFYEGFRGMDVLFALVQGDPVDEIVGIFVRYHDTGIEERPGEYSAGSFGFSADMPNPIKGKVSISYATTIPGHVSLNIYDGVGRIIRTLVNAVEPAGKKNVYWNGKDSADRAVPDGVYFLKLESENKIDTQKLLFIR